MSAPDAVPVQVALEAWAPSFEVEAWDTDNGLPQNTVRAVLRARSGHIWVGTGDGLARYDGSSFAVFSRANTPGFPEQPITILAEAADGAIWIAVRGSGLFRVHGERLEKIAPPSGLPAGRVYALAADADGGMWVGTNGGLTRLRGGEATLFTIEHGLPGAKVTELHVARNGDLWVGTSRGLAIFAGGQFTLDRTLGSAGGAEVRLLLEAADGARWIATESEIIRQQGDAVTRFGAAAGIAPPNALALAEDRDGHVWLGATDGLFRFDGRRFQLETLRGAAVRDAVHCVFPDEEGNVWLGTTDGLKRLRRTAFTAYGTGEALSHNVVTSVAQDADGAFWIGTAGGGLNHLRRGARTVYRKEHGLPSDGIRALVPGRDGGLWAGFDTSGLVHLKDGKVTRHRRSGTFAGSTTNVLFEDRHGLLWLGRRNGVWTFKDGVFAEPPGLEAFATTSVKAFAEDDHGTLWIGTSDGLVRHAGGRFEVMRKEQGLPSNNVDAIRSEPGTLWLGTDGAGLVWLRDGKFHACGTAQGLHSDTIFEIVDDRRGHFWLSSRQGIARVAKAQLLALGRGERSRVDCTVFGKADGLTGGEGSSAAKPGGWRSADGRVWFATAKGLVAVDPARLPAAPAPPAVVITRVRADGRDVPIARALTLPPGRGELEFAFTALSYSQPQKVRFRYQLEGVNDGWIEAGARRTAGFSGVPPGRLRFRVQAAVGDGPWSESPAECDLRIEPHFFQTWWFYLAIGALVAGSAYGAYALRVRAMRERERELVGIVRDRTGHLEREVAEHRRTGEALRASEALYHSLVEVLPVSIYRKDIGGRYLFVNGHFCRKIGRPAAQIIGRTVHDLFPAEVAARREAVDRRVIATREPCHGEEAETLPDGSECWHDRIKVAVLDSTGAVVGTQGLSWDITPRKLAEREAAEAQRELIALSHRAGMAEVATGVLHNVGNVLNSVNVSVTVIANRVRGLRIASLGKVAGLLREHEPELAAFLTGDARGRAVPRYLAQLGEVLAGDQAEMISELGQLRANLEHIKAIVAMQQEFAKSSRVMEELALDEVVDDALRINGESLARHGISLTRAYVACPLVPLERHKVAQILVNLIENAKHACEAAASKEITVGISCDSAVARVSVRDSGVGIAPENLTRIFAHGFTTKVDGHGFGLHSSALAARAMGGRLTAHSAGPGQGAEFILELPLASAAATVERAATAA
ncbi:MAG: PAS domain-containing protein [Opitutaceae bacterium]|nr:PAS domain-containing protein [Opitutaceae bacterium]